MTLVRRREGQAGRARVHRRVPHGVAARSRRPARRRPDAGVTATKFGDRHRSDGTKQLTVNGSPLYTWMGDKKAGDVDRPGRQRLLRRAGERREVRPGRRAAPERSPSSSRSGPSRSPGRTRPAGCLSGQTFGKKSDTMRSSTTGPAVEVGPRRLEVRDFHRPAPRLTRDRLRRAQPAFEHVADAHRPVIREVLLAVEEQAVARERARGVGARRSRTSSPSRPRAGGRGTRPRSPSRTCRWAGPGTRSKPAVARGALRRVDRGCRPSPRGRTASPAPCSISTRTGGPHSFHSTSAGGSSNFTRRSPRPRRAAAAAT